MPTANPSGGGGAAALQTGGKRNGQPLLRPSLAPAPEVSETETQIPKPSQAKTRNPEFIIQQGPDLRDLRRKFREGDFFDPWLHWTLLDNHGCSGS